jgi:hypothetical protein
VVDIFPLSETKVRLRPVVDISGSERTVGPLVDIPLSQTTLGQLLTYYYVLKEK